MLLDGATTDRMLARSVESKRLGDHGKERSRTRQAYEAGVFERGNHFGWSGTCHIVVLDGSGHDNKLKL